MSFMLLLALGLRPASIQELESGGTFVAEDPDPEAVRRFFAESGLPYAQTFVSIGCFRQAQGLRKLEELFAQPGGKVAILDPKRVMADIKVAAHEDIQALATRGTHGRQLSECSRCFVWPSEGCTIEQALLRAADCAERYSEARIYRPLVREDILRYA